MQAGFLDRTRGGRRPAGATRQSRRCHGRRRRPFESARVVDRARRAIENPVHQERLSRSSRPDPRPRGGRAVHADRPAVELVEQRAQAGAIERSKPSSSTSAGERVAARSRGSPPRRRRFRRSTARSRAPAQQGARCAAVPRERARSRRRRDVDLDAEPLRGAARISTSPPAGSRRGARSTRSGRQRRSEQTRARVARPA